MGINLDLNWDRAMSGDEFEFWTYALRNNSSILYSLLKNNNIDPYKENAWCKINEIAEKRIFEEKDKTVKYWENEYVTYLDELKSKYDFIAKKYKK